jgi:uncharacterized protein YbaP (TraB family)
MIKYLAMLAGILSGILSDATAQEKTPVTEDNRSLLWSITGRDMTQPSYIFGTIHLLCREDYVWTPAMRRSLLATKEVCFEMDMDDPSLMMEVAMGMIDRSGKTLEDYFTKSDYDLVERFVKDSLGMSMTMFRQMKPAALQSLFATRAVTCASPVSYEVNIMEEAKKQNKKITGLEKASEQLALFDKLNADSVVKELVGMVKDYSGERREFDRMLAAYKRQDLPQLYEIIEASKISGEDLNSFLYDRNRKWILRMEDKMEQNPVFFAVGAGHLWGDNGVIALLRKEGYTVSSIK